VISKTRTRLPAPLFHQPFGKSLSDFA